jgi:hypothetical protein
LKDRDELKKLKTNLNYNIKSEDDALKIIHELNNKNKEVT